MLGLQMDMPLMISGLIEHAALYHGDTEIVARTIEGGLHRYDYAQAHARTKQLAQALIRLGIRPGDRVGTLAWNTHRHFEMFYGVSGLGAVLHTVNPRLFAEQIIYIVNHAEDDVLFIDAATLPIVEQIASRLATVKTYVMMTDKALMPATPSLPSLLCYEELIGAETGDFVWPQFDEKTASSICYTSGTTGNPKGVVYSHRSAILVAMLFSGFVGIGAKNGSAETLMPMAPMFHGNAWQFPYLAPMTGSRLVLPGRNYELLEGERVTVTCGVPTMWIILTDWLERTGNKFSTLRLSLSSGSAPPRALVEKLERAYGVELAQAWGMTEALGGSLATMRPGSADLPFDARIDRRMKSGRTSFGVKYRIVDDTGRELP
ncbi:MAG: AMP-binding protein, partial [Chloroflexi bacterium]|nr:AMP-binding protein [Chloroflexota bacterium]